MILWPRPTAGVNDKSGVGGAGVSV